VKISIIVTLYKDLASLKIVLEALREQTYKEFEIIIAEDDDSPKTIDFLKDYKDLNIIHLSQPDTGRNKVIIQNKAIARASGEYLFFIDGDIVPFKHFIEYSLKIARPKRILSGRRVNLDENTTKLIKEGKLDIQDLEKNYLLFLWKNRKNREVRAEQGIEIDPDSFLYKYILSKRKRNTEILGCNFSCFKEDIVAINGFDEDYHPLACLADDTDLTWRFKGMGYELYSSKNVACCFHLWHPIKNNGYDKGYIDKNNMIQKQKNKQFICKNGLNKYLNKE